MVLAENLQVHGRLGQSLFTKDHRCIGKPMNFSRPQLSVLVALRLLVGWHFLYEGVVKLFNPYWTAKVFLLTSEGMLRPLFLWLAEEPMISVVNVANTALLIGVGAALLLGTLTRVAAVAGIVLLLMYYLAHPPLMGMSGGPGAGSFWIVNYNLIEIAVLLLVFYFPTSRQFGLDVILGKANGGQSHD